MIGGPPLRLAVVYLLLALGGLLAWKLVPFRTDFSFFIPAGSTAEARLLQDKMTNGPAAGLLLISISGDAPARLAAASGRLAEALEQSGLFLFVANGRLQVTPADREAVVRHRYLLRPLPDPAALDAAGLRRSLGEALATLGSSAGFVMRDLIPIDPTGRLLVILRHWQGATGEIARDAGVWVSADRSRALLVAQTRAPAFDTAAQQQAARRLFAEAEALREASGLVLEVTGPAAFAAMISGRIEAEVRLLTIGSTAIALLLVAGVLRSLRVIPVAFVPIGVGLLAGTAAVAALFGHIHGITLAFGAAVVGVAVDYPILLWAHLAPGEAAVAAARRIWPTLRLGAAATAAALVPMAFSRYGGLAQLGVFAVAGILTAAAATRWLLPALISPLPPRAELGSPPSQEEGSGSIGNQPSPPRGEGDAKRRVRGYWGRTRSLRSGTAVAPSPSRCAGPSLSPWGRGKKALQRIFCQRGARCGALAVSPAAAGEGIFRVTVSALALAAMALAGIAGGPRWQDDLSALTPIPAAALALDRNLRAEMKTADVSHLLLVWGDDAEAVLAGSEGLEPRLQALVAAGAITGYDMAARYLPSAAAQRRLQGALPEKAVLERSLAEALQGRPFRPGTFDRFVLDVEAARIAPPVNLETFRGTLGEIRLAALLQPFEGRWVGLVTLAGVADPARVAGIVSDSPGLAYLDLKQAATELIRAQRREALAWLGWGALGVVLLLAAVLRRPVHILRVAAPIALALGATVAALAALDVALTSFHVIALLLVAGVGLDYALFFNRPGRSRATRTAVLLCCGTTATVFALLATSSFALLQGIGLTVAIGTVASALLAWVMARPPDTLTGGDGGPDNSR